MRHRSLAILRVGLVLVVVGCNQNVGGGVGHVAHPNPDNFSLEKGLAHFTGTR